MENATAKNAIYRDKTRRVWELDFLRGLAVICMCFDHLMCDFIMLDGWFSNFDSVKKPFINALVKFADMYWDSAFRFWAHYIFVFLFLFLVGTSCSFSRDNTTRGAQLGAVAMAFTGVTMIIKQMGLFRYGIIFGILHCIALSILCASAVDIATKSNKILNIYLPLVLGTVIIAVGISNRFWDISFDRTFSSAHLLGYILGEYAYGDDWFGLFPNVGCVLLGLYWGKAVYSTRVSLAPRLSGAWNKPFRFVGRHALIFYLVHQIALAGLVGLLCLCLGYRF